MEAKPPKSPWFWVGIGCGAMMLMAVALLVFVAVVVFGSMRSSAPYRDAVARAQTDPRVTELLGSPVKPGYWFSGSINTQNRDGNANLDIPISGPKGKATLRVVGVKQRGRWTYSEMIVTPPTGPEINLLGEAAERSTP